MPYQTPPERIKKFFNDENGPRVWMHAFNSTFEKFHDEARASKAAWGAVENAGYVKDEKTGKYVKKKKTAWAADGTKKQPILAPGTYFCEDEHGRKTTWEVTAATLNEIAANFTAPVPFGPNHYPKGFAPMDAGRTPEVVVEGDVLYAYLAPDEALKAAIDSGYYVYVSGEYTRGEAGWKLDRVAALDRRILPAYKDQPPLHAADGEVKTALSVYSLADGAAINLLEKTEEVIKVSDEKDVVTLTPDELEKKLADAKEAGVKEANDAHAQHAAEGDAGKQLAKLAADVKSLSEENTTLARKVLLAEAEKRMARRVPADMRPEVAALYVAMAEGGKTVKLAIPDKADKSKTQEVEIPVHEAFMAFVEKMPQLVATGEFATEAGPHSRRPGAAKVDAAGASEDADAASRDAKVRAYMAEHSIPPEKYAEAHAALSAKGEL